MVKKVTCPECGASVPRTSLRRHMRKAHPPGAASPSRERRRWWKGSYGLLLLAVVAALVILIVYLTAVEKTKIALMETNLGTIKIELDTARAPTTAGNFIRLAENGFYDGLTFHRIARDFVIQGGDPAGNGTGGSNESLPWEDTGLKNDRYTIAMARAGDANDGAYSGTATSQFFISLKDNPALDEYAYPFVVFGRVVEGFDVVNKIGALYPIEGDGPPTERVEMTVSIKTEFSLKGLG
jgi:cyclophilin family peptidyl-prolyl cis-trans isomerase